MALICAYPVYQMPEVEPFAVSWWQGLRAFQTIPHQAAKADSLGYPKLI